MTLLRSGEKHDTPPEWGIFQVALRHVRQGYLMIRWRRAFETASDLEWT